MDLVQTKYIYKGNERYIKNKNNIRFFMKIAIIGYGKMGKTIENIALKNGDNIILRITDENTHELTLENLQKADVAIEFTRPEVAFGNIKTCLEAGVPIVSGTTGWLSKLTEIQAITKQNNGAFFYASNFSVGVNIFFALNKKLAAMMNEQPNYIASIHEIHHTQKLDAPSGTAITLGEDIIENIHQLKAWTSQKKQPDELHITSARINKTPGTHIVTYTSDIDEIEIIHTAKSREGFAQGALMAARWLIGKQGCFGMSDMLGM